MKNKDFAALIASMLLLIGILIYITGCTKIEVPMPVVIDLGKKSEFTAIKQISIVENIISAQFRTTSGAKYSVQVVPFGSDEPVMKDGFTATDSITTKVYNLKAIAKKDYDVIFMDIQGKEIKYPITIK